MAAFPVVIGCTTVTDDEARETLDATLVAAKTMSLESALVELALPTEAGAPNQVATEVQTLIAERAPCVTVTGSDARRVVDFGAAGCAFLGRTVKGKMELSFRRAGSGELVISEEWTEVTDGEATLDGVADIAWASNDSPMHVKHDAFWTSKDGVRLEGQGDRTMVRRRSGKVIRTSGVRSWTGDEGLWVLTMHEADVNGLEPMPEAGVFQIDPPSKNTMSMAFSRLADGILVRVFGGWEERRYAVLGLGKVEELEPPNVRP